MIIRVLCLFHNQWWTDWTFQPGIWQASVDWQVDKVGPRPITKMGKQLVLCRSPPLSTPNLLNYWPHGCAHSYPKGKCLSRPWVRFAQSCWAVYILNSFSTTSWEIATWVCSAAIPKRGSSWLSYSFLATSNTCLEPRGVWDTQGTPARFPPVQALDAHVWDMSSPSHICQGTGTSSPGKGWHNWLMATTLLAVIPV